MGVSVLTPRAAGLISVGLLASAAMLSQLGIIALVAQGYTLMAYGFLALFALPLLTVGVKVDLPKTKAGLIQDQVEPLAVTVSASGQIFLQDKEIELSVLAPRLIAITGANPDVRIFVRGDKAIEYGRVMEVMGTLNAAGFNKVALITEMPHSGAKKTSSKKPRKIPQSNAGKK